jgi:uncharacterized protein YjbJ (UPF0337 family)
VRERGGRGSNFGCGTRYRSAFSEVPPDQKFGTKPAWEPLDLESAPAFRPVMSQTQGNEEKQKQMKQGTKDEIKGKLHEVKGKAKEKVGQVTNNPNMEAEGVDEKLAGKVQKKVGQVEKVFEK